jgi:hypothetical protein
MKPFETSTRFSATRRLTTRTVYGALVVRLRSVIARIAEWPDSALEVIGRPGIRVVPLIRYPYKVFYRRTDEIVEILYIHHAAQDEP